jgi:ATP/maltotriose-dependent transcriptional regulator MalT
VESARDKAEQALVMTDARGWSSGGPRAVLGFLELSLEQYEAAYEALEPAVERYRSLGAPVIGQTFDVAEALAGMGRAEEGRALLDAAEGASSVRFPWAIAAAARARGLLAEAKGDLDAGQAALETAVETGEQVGMPLELGRSLLALGGVQRRARRKRTARRTLGQALDIFEGLGARLWAERARRELARIGGRSAPPREGLSGTEAEIVELVVAGRSNKEVAQALHLSTKTVEWNLSKVYRRLGVRSRTQLAAVRRGKG